MCVWVNILKMHALIPLRTHTCMCKHLLKLTEITYRTY